MLYPAWESLNPIIRKYTWDQLFILKINGEPVDLIGYDFYVEIMEDVDSPVVTERLSVDGGHVGLGQYGEIYISMTPAQTGSIPAGTYHYVATLVYPDGVTQYPILIGKVNVVTWDKVG